MRTSIDTESLKMQPLNSLRIQRRRVTRDRHARISERAVKVINILKAQILKFETY